MDWLFAGFVWSVTMFGGGYIVGHIRGYWQAVAEITSKIPPRSDGDE